jgi:hypothetical protein
VVFSASFLLIVKLVGSMTSTNAEVCFFLFLHLEEKITSASCKFEVSDFGAMQKILGILLEILGLFFGANNLYFFVGSVGLTRDIGMKYNGICEELLVYLLLLEEWTV